VTERDIRDILRDRPVTVPQAFATTTRLHLLCPPESGPSTFEAAKIAFGPFSASVLTGFVLVTVPARMDEAQDLWDLVMRDAMPGDEQREPGGEPLQTIRTATLGWRLLALLGGSIELLAGASSAVRAWRDAGQATGLRCDLGSRLLSFQTRGAAATAAHLQSLAVVDQARLLMGYPTERVLRRFLSERDAGIVAARCTRSATFVADLFSVTASVVVDPFWRTFMKWKHGAIGTSPGAGPLWINDTPDLDADRLEERLQSGIVVFDAQGDQRLYVRPTQRVDLVAYSHMTVQVLLLAQLIAESVLCYGQQADVWPIALYEIEPGHEPSAAERRALGRLANSEYRIAALGGVWRG
jgi:hypothetical protein